MSVVSKVVLHVDDDQSVLRLVSRILSTRGIEVVSITDPMQAIQKIVETGTRVVILDIDMPGKDGLTLLREIKSFDAGIHVIMCTGMVTMSTILSATSLGAEGCIFKPIEDFEAVTFAVERAFEDINRWWDALREWNKRKKQSEDLLRQQKTLAKRNKNKAKVQVSGLRTGHL